MKSTSPARSSVASRSNGLSLVITWIAGCSATMRTMASGRMRVRPRGRAPTCTTPCKVPRRAVMSDSMWRNSFNARRIGNRISWLAGVGCKPRGVRSKSDWPQPLSMTLMVELTAG
ncbi:hypothetical protein D3C76_1044810 [compost metagenome]